MKTLPMPKKRKHTSKYIGINVSDEVYESISQKSSDEGLSLSAFIRRILINKTK